MKQLKISLIAVISIAVFSISTLAAQTKIDDKKYEFGQAEHLLDGYSMNFQYQNGAAVHIEFNNGMAKYEWITGPMKGNGNKDIPYQSKKIGNSMYLVNWHETELKDFLTFVYDFEKMLVHNSVIIGYENKPERKRRTMFKAGIIDHLTIQ